MIRNGWKIVVLSAATIGVAVAAPCAAQEPAPAPAAETAPEAPAANDVAALVSLLNNPGISQDERNEAARRLLQRNTDEARAALRGVLVDVGNRGGQLAVAQALASIPTPLEMFKDPLFALLGPDTKLTEAGAQALANFKGNPEVLNRLANFANDRRGRAPVRTSTIKALGTLVEKRAAEIIMNLLTRDAEDAEIRNAAADALMQMTGLRANGRDVQVWQQWWAANGGKNDADFKNDLLYSRAARFDQLQLRYSTFRNEVQAQLAAHYQSVAEPQKPEVLVRYLKSPEPEIRTVGARLIHDDAINARPIGAVAKERLREMIGDSAPEVRMEVARAFRVINDADALEALLAQLAQEPNPDVRAELAAAIAPILDLRAVPALLKQLDDSSYRAAEAAANALGRLAPVIRKTAPEMVPTVSGKIVGLIDAMSGIPAAAGLRETSVEALIPLEDPNMLAVFSRLLRPEESARVRKAALRGLAELRDPRAADTIANSLLLDDADPSVRLRAVEALGSTATFAHAQRLWERMNPANEPDAAVRKAAWTALQSLFPNAPLEQLAQWADRFRDQPEQRLTVLLAMRDSLVRNRDEDQLAVIRQNIGETLLKLSRPDEAAQYFKMSLDYYRAREVRDMVTEGLVRQYMDALLGSKKYQDACQFAADSIRANSDDQPTMGSKIRVEVERLRDSGNVDDALALIEQASKMNPPLDSRYMNQLDSIRDDLRRRGDPTDATLAPRSAASN